MRKVSARDEGGLRVGGGDMTARLAGRKWRRHEAQERLDLVVAATQTGIWDWGLRNNTMYIPRWKSSLGHEEQEISNCRRSGKPGCIPTIRRVPSPWWMITFRADASAANPARLRHKDGTYR